VKLKKWRNMSERNRLQMNGGGCSFQFHGAKNIKRFRYLFVATSPLKKGQFNYFPGHVIVSLLGDKGKKIQTESLTIYIKKNYTISSRFIPQSSACRQTWRIYVIIRDL